METAELPNHSQSSGLASKESWSWLWLWLPLSRCKLGAWWARTASLPLYKAHIAPSPPRVLLTAQPSSSFDKLKVVTPLNPWIWYHLPLCIIKHWLRCWKAIRHVTWNCCCCCSTAAMVQSLQWRQPAWKISVLEVDEALFRRPATFSQACTKTANPK